MILDAVGMVLGEAVGVLLSPLPVAAVVLILFSRRAVPSAVAFVAGWIAGLAAFGTVVLLLAGAADVGSDHDATKGSGAVHIALGAGMILLAVREWRQRPRRGQPAPPPKWMARLEGVKPGRALVLGVLLCIVNPKNLVLVVSAATSVAQTGLTTADNVLAWAVFVLLATLGVAAPLVYRLARGQHADATLQGWRTWLETHNAAVLAVVLLVIGAKVLGMGMAVVS